MASTRYQTTEYNRCEGIAMSAKIYQTGKAPPTVKNLGWLLRHSAEVQDIWLVRLPHGAHSDAILSVRLTDGREYRTNFASWDILREWVKRPCLRGVPTFEVSTDITADPEDMQVRGNVMASGDDAADKAEEDAIIKRLDSGDVWAWAYVQVRASCEDYRAIDELSGCSYADSEDFMRDGSYFDDMVINCLDIIRFQVDASFATAGGQ